MSRNEQGARFAARVGFGVVGLLSCALVLAGVGVPAASAAGSSSSSHSSGGGSSSSSHSSGGGSSSSSGGGSSSSSGGGSSSSSGGSGVASGAPINVAAISSQTGPLAADFGDFIPGAKAYFQMIDAQGGVNGHKINLQWNLDDQGLPSQFTADAHTAVNQDHAFAVFVSSYWFSPGFFVQNNVPTYGYNTSANWQGPPNLFASGGSVLCYPCIVPEYSFMLKKLGIKSIAFLGYNVSASKDACTAAMNGLKSAGFNVAYSDLSVPVDGNITPAVQHLQQSGAKWVLSCMDVQENIALAKAIHQYGIKITQLWLNGSDQSVVNTNSGIMQNVYFAIPYVPPSAPTNVYPGLAAYQAAMKKYEPKYAGTELAVQGWMTAALLAAGVKAAGSNVTPQSVVQATNKITNFNGAGLGAVTDWTTAHTKSVSPLCYSLVRVKGKSLVAQFTTGHQVFLCFNANTQKNPKPVAAPSGTPGAS